MNDYLTNEYSMIKNDPLRILRSYGVKGVIIDEAQKMPELFSAIQFIVDETGKMGQFILTGSQNFLLLEKVSQICLNHGFFRQR